MSSQGPNGSDEMADAGGDTSRYIEDDTVTLQFGPAAVAVTRLQPLRRPSRPGGG